MNLTALVRLVTATLGAVAALVATVRQLATPRHSTGVTLERIRAAAVGDGPQPTAREVFGEMEKATQDAINAYVLAGFTEDQAKSMIRDQMSAAHAANMGPVFSSPTRGTSPTQVRDDLTRRVARP